MKVFRLDDFVMQNRLPTPNIIKMNCQEAEESIIRGEGRRCSKLMCRSLKPKLVRGEKFFDDCHRLYEAWTRAKYPYLT